MRPILFTADDLYTWLEQSLDALHAWENRQKNPVQHVVDNVLFDRITSAGICLGVPGVEFISVAATPIEGLRKPHNLFACRMGDVVLHRNERITLQELEQRAVAVYRAAYKAAGEDVINPGIETSVMARDELLEKIEITGCSWTDFLGREIGARRQAHVQAIELHQSSSLANSGMSRRF